MARIYKYQLELIPDVQMIQVKSPHFFLHFDMQNDIPCVWATADPDGGDMECAYQIVGTGGEIPPEGKHVGTALQPTITGFVLMSYVWHLYQVWGESLVQAVEV